VLNLEEEEEVDVTIQKAIDRGRREEEREKIMTESGGWGRPCWVEVWVGGVWWGMLSSLG